MVKVHLWSGLRALADGHATVEVVATDVRQMLAALVEKHPGLEPAIEAGVSVSIDGRIIANAVIEKVSPDNEIYLLQRLEGG